MTSANTLDNKMLDDFVNGLQSEIYRLIKEHEARDDTRKFHEALGLAKAIEYVNSNFRTNYETSIAPIVKNYEIPLRR